jgi:hypothetical protein
MGVMMRSEMQAGNSRRPNRQYALFLILILHILWAAWCAAHVIGSLRLILMKFRA